MSIEQEPGNQRDLAYYRQCFRELNVNRTERGEAPYQPILLLSVIDLIAEGLIQANHIHITEELRNTFNKYRNILSPDRSFDSSLSMPFFHLQNEEYQFWYLDYKAEYYRDISSNKKLINEKIRKSIKQLKNYVNHAYIDQELFNLLQDDDSRKELVDTLVAKWFTSSEDIAEDKTEYLLRANKYFQNFIEEEIKKLNKPDKLAPKFYFRKSAAREAVFGKAVVGIYDY
ncbi:MAG TPA: hypothetical protein VIQ31_01055, partial [Phormidium sp.]